jgi:hypothetical protein
MGRLVLLLDVENLFTGDRMAALADAIQAGARLAEQAAEAGQQAEPQVAGETMAQSLASEPGAGLPQTSLAQAVSPAVSLTVPPDGKQASPERKGSHNKKKRAPAPKTAKAPPSPEAVSA